MWCVDRAPAILVAFVQIRHVVGEMRVAAEWLAAQFDESWYFDESR